MSYSPPTWVTVHQRCHVIEGLRGSPRGIDRLSRGRQSDWGLGVEGEKMFTLRVWSFDDTTPLICSCCMERDMLRPHPTPFAGTVTPLLLGGRLMACATPAPPPSSPPGWESPLWDPCHSLGPQAACLPGGAPEVWMVWIMWMAEAQNVLRERLDTSVEGAARHLR